MTDRDDLARQLTGQQVTRARAGFSAGSPTSNVRQAVGAFAGFSGGKR